MLATPAKAKAAAANSIPSLLIPVSGNELALEALLELAAGALACAGADTELAALATGALATD